jgi:2-methylisocitrate lyase-like PEP mutase family enzyme
MTGGSALSQSKYGIGDYGMITMDDLVEFCNRTADRVGVPIIADADDGGGNPLNVYRTVQRMEKAGAACIMIEDLYGAKHIAGFDEGKIISREAMVDKVHAAVDARRDPSTVLLVRSDVVADGGSLDEAIERVALYAEEGGDVIFVPGIPLDQCPRAVETAGRPILTGAPSVRAARDNQVSILFIGAMGAIATGAIDRAMTELARDGQIGDAGVGSLGGQRRLELIGNEVTVERARQYNVEREGGQ